MEDMVPIAEDVPEILLGFTIVAFSGFLVGVVLMGVLWWTA